MAEVPEYVSHSALSQYIHCGKQFELQRVAKVPAPPAWYLIGGSAVHKATEWLDLKVVDNPELAWERAFDEEIEEAYRDWPDDGQWIMAGRPRRDGSGQGYDHWNQRGLAAVEAWVGWRVLHPELELVEAEWEFTLPIEGRIFHGYVDRVFKDARDDSIVLTDLKSGTKRPENAHQLGIYKVAWEQSPSSALFGPVSRCGFWMAKDGTQYDYDMSPYTPQVLGRIAEQYVRGVENDIFLPNVGGHCFGCTVRSACGILNPKTSDARRYDSLIKEK